MSTYAEDYRKSVDEIKNNLFQLTIKFRDLRGNMIADYNNGLIEEEDYERLSKLGLTYCPKDEFSKYFLSKEEIEYIKSNGKLYGDDLDIKLVRDYYDEKADVLDSICYSAIKGDELSRMSLDELRIYLRKSFEEKYDSKEKELSDKLDYLQSIFKDKAHIRPDYNKAVEDLAKLSATRVNFASRIGSMNRVDLLDWAFKLFDVNDEYYGWFEQRRVKEELEIGSSFEDAVLVSQGVEEKVSGVEVKAKELIGTVLNNEDFIKKYFEFTNKFFVEHSIWTMYENVRKGTFESSKKFDERLKEEEKRVFNYLYQDPIVKEYIINEVSVSDSEDEFMTMDEDGNKTLDMNFLFEAYMSKFFSDKLLNVPDFISFVINSANTSGSMRMKSVMSATRNSINIFDCGVDSLVREAGKNTSYAMTNRYYVETSKDSRRYQLPVRYVGPNEESLIYESITTTISENYGKGESLSYKK